MDAFYRGFRAGCVLRALGTCAALLVMVTLLVTTSLYGTMLLAGAAACFLLRSLIRYAERFARDGTRLLRAVPTEGLPLSFPGVGGHGIVADFYAALNGVGRCLRETRAALEETACSFEMLAHHVRDGLICVRPDGGVTLANRSALRLFRIADLRRVQDLASFDGDVARAVLGLPAGQSAIVKADARGEAVTLSLEAAGVRIRGESLTLVSARRIGTEIEATAEEASSDLLRVVTHETARILAPIALHVGYLRSRLSKGNGTAGGTGGPGADAKLVEAVSTIERLCEGLLRFVRDCQQVATIPMPVPGPVRAIELLTDATRLLGAEAEAKGIDVSVRVDPPSLVITADGDLVEQVLINLVTNAIEAVEGRAGARVEVTARMEGTSPLIEVADNGPGILPGHQTRIFLPTFTTKDKGSGIGLTVAREIARLHNGSLSVRSEPEVETVFSFRFPKQK